MAHINSDILRLGVDVGSTTVKAVALDPADNSVLFTRYQRHNAHQADTVRQLLEEAAGHFPGMRFRIGVCGSGGRAIAAALGITAGTLTSAVNLLEKKGYLLRRRDERDKRVVHLLPTERGRAADARHRDFHRQMVAHVLDGLTDEEAECTLRALGRVAEFFRRGAPERG